MAFLRNQHGQLIRKDGSLVPRAVVRRGPGHDRASHLKVDRILGGPGPLRTEYEKLLETPGVYLRDLQAFLRKHGHEVCLHTIRTHRRKHRDEFRSLREAARMAEAYCRITRNEGQGAIVDAAQGRFEMLMMQDLFELKEKAQLPPETWERWSKALGSAVTTRRSVEQMREEFERKAKQAAAEAEKIDPSEAGKRVAQRVREILGV